MWLMFVKKYFTGGGVNRKFKFLCSVFFLSFLIFTIIGCGKTTSGSDGGGGSGGGSTPPPPITYDLRVIETALFTPPLFGEVTITYSNGDIVPTSSYKEYNDENSSTKDTLYKIPAGKTVSFNYYNSIEEISDEDYQVSYNIVGDDWRNWGHGAAFRYTTDKLIDEMDCDVQISLNIFVWD